MTFVISKFLLFGSNVESPKLTIIPILTSQKYNFRWFRLGALYVQYFVSYSHYNKCFCIVISDTLLIHLSLLNKKTLTQILFKFWIICQKLLLLFSHISCKNKWKKNSSIIFSLFFFFSLLYYMEKRWRTHYFAQEPINHNLKSWN